VFHITIYVIWQLKEADLKPFSVLVVNIVRLGLFFLAKKLWFIWCTFVI